MMARRVPRVMWVPQDLQDLLENPLDMTLLLCQCLSAKEDLRVQILSKMMREECSLRNSMRRS